jgi:hypothetical protein
MRDAGCGVRDPGSGIRDPGFGIRGSDSGFQVQVRLVRLCDGDDRGLRTED